MVILIFQQLLSSVGLLSQCENFICGDEEYIDFSTQNVVIHMISDKRGDNTILLVCVVLFQCRNEAIHQIHIMTSMKVTVCVCVCERLLFPKLVFLSIFGNLPPIKIDNQCISDFKFISGNLCVSNAANKLFNYLLFKGKTLNIAAIQRPSDYSLHKAKDWPVFYPS